MELSRVKALAQRGINYHDEAHQFKIPIIDSAFVTMPFRNDKSPGRLDRSNVIGCLELCMFAEGSRHQEEIIVTGNKVRLMGGSSWVLESNASSYSVLLLCTICQLIGAFGSISTRKQGIHVHATD